MNLILETFYMFGDNDNVEWGDLLNEYNIPTYNLPRLYIIYFIFLEKIQFISSRQDNFSYESSENTFLDLMYLGQGCGSGSAFIWVRYKIKDKSRLKPTIFSFLQE